MDTHTLDAYQVQPGDLIAGVPVSGVVRNDYDRRVTIYLGPDNENFLTFGKKCRLNVQREEKFSVELTREEAALLLVALGNAASSGQSAYPGSTLRVGQVRDSISKKVEKVSGVTFSEAREQFQANSYYTLSAVKDAKE